MKILIVEDETLAYENLVGIISEIDPSVEIIGNTESISQTVNWLNNNTMPDLILMDIHLSDGSAFDIFDCINVETPIIFTTAYDEYAINAFKVNSIDYILKPIKPEELKQAFDKFKKWTQTDISQHINNISQLASSPSHKDRLLIPVRDKLIPIVLSKVSFFYTTNKNTIVMMKDGNSHPYSKTLEQIYTSLNPTDFFRANKQFIVARNSVQEITVWFDNRLLVSLNTETPERLYVSKNRAVEFKNWMVNK
ncbi:MAG: LytR/AlgR family response regulator transcription factor [Bacteroidales bacterium]